MLDMNKRAAKNENPIRAARTRLGLTQFALAVQAGLHPATIAIVERGANPSRQTAEKLAKALGVSASELGARTVTSEAAEA